MSETRHAEEPEQRIEHDAAELEERLDRLESHIDDAQRKADERREDANPAEKVAGDWEDTRGTPGQGEDPEGAVDR